MGVKTPTAKREATHNTKSHNSDDMDNPLIAPGSHHGSMTSLMTSSNGQSQSNDDKNSQRTANPIDSQRTPKSSTANASSSWEFPKTFVTSTLKFHVSILYAINICLILTLASALVVTYVQIMNLKQDLLDHKTMTSKFIFNIDLYKPKGNSAHIPTHPSSSPAPFSPYHKSSYKFQRHWDDGIGSGHGNEGEGSDGARQEEGEGMRKRRQKRQKRQASSIKVTKGNDKGTNFDINKKEDWLWMSSFTRVPRSKEDMIAYLKSYCREAQLYCAAGSGKPGPPGPAGKKGDIGPRGPIGTRGLRGYAGRQGFGGMKGDKGEPGTTPVVQNLANGQGVIRGPPGPSGAKGEKGDMGFGGARGHPGPKGKQGQPGIDGTQGPRGAKGDPGLRGLLGFPGHKGSQGPVGPRGPKGEMGMRGVEGTGGPKGDRGHRGVKGDRGHSGTPGVPGYKGLPGNHGMRGRKGERGYVGPRGPSGYCEAQCMTSRKPTTADCSIKRIGKPVYIRNSTQVNGAFMVDTSPEVKGSAGKVWVTWGLTGNKITEFSSFQDFKADRPGRVYDLQGFLYFGTGHVVYKGCFFYQQANNNMIVKFNFTSGKHGAMRNIKYASYSDTHGYLYGSKKSFFHFQVDSNGLWVVYVKAGKLNVAMLDPSDLNVVNSVKLNVEKESKGNSFIACGKLYTLDSPRQRLARIDEEIDIWSGKSKAIRLSFSNPFGQNKMINFDYRNKRLYTWDAKYQLSVPVLKS